MIKGLHGCFQQVGVFFVRVLIIRALVLGCSGDLVSLFSNRTYRASSGFLWWLIGDTN